MGFIWNKFSLTPFSKRLFVFQTIVVAVYICEYFFEKAIGLSPFMSFTLGIICIPVGIVAGIYFSGLSKEDLTVIEAIESKFKVRMPIFFKKVINHQY